MSRKMKAISGRMLSFFLSFAMLLAFLPVTHVSAEEANYSVFYIANSENTLGDTVDPDSPYQAGDTVAVLENGFTREGFAFLYWTSDPAAPEEESVQLIPGETFVMPAEDVSLYAVWEELDPEEPTDPEEPVEAEDPPETEDPPEDDDPNQEMPAEPDEPGELPEIGEPMEEPENTEALNVPIQTSEFTPAATAKDLAELLAAISDAGETQHVIEIGEKIELTEMIEIPAGKDIVLINDGKAYQNADGETIGSTIKRATAANYAMFIVEKGATLTIAARPLTVQDADGNDMENPDDTNRFFFDSLGAEGDNDGGGAIIHNEGTFNLQGGTLKNAVLTYSDTLTKGVVYVSDATFNMEGGYIADNFLVGDSGAVYATDATVKMTGGEISHNGLSSAADIDTVAAVNLDGKSDFEMKGGVINQNNMAEYVDENDNATTVTTAPAGGIYAAGNEPINVVFGDDGKLVDGPDYLKVKITGGTINNNKGGMAGGIHVINTVLTLDSEAVEADGVIAIRGNEGDITAAGRTAGGVRVGVGSFATITNVHIDQNTGTYGGGIMAEGRHTIVDGNLTVIENNNALVGGSTYGHGGGIATWSADGIVISEPGDDPPMHQITFELKGGTVKGNKADRAGGGVYSHGDDDNSTQFYLNPLTITGNTATSVAGVNNSGMGGGLFEDENSSIFTVNYYLAVLANTASTAADDIATLAKVAPEDQGSTYRNVMVGGTEVTFYNDIAGTRYDADNPGTLVVPPVDPANKEALNLKSVGAANSLDRAKYFAAVTITENESALGGGIYINGDTFLGTLEDHVTVHVYYDAGSGAEGGRFSDPLIFPEDGYYYTQGNKSERRALFTKKDGDKTLVLMGWNKEEGKTESDTGFIKIGEGVDADTENGLTNGTVLYAVWGDGFDFEYMPNGAPGEKIVDPGSPYDPMDKVKSSDIEIMANPYTRPGYTFVHWTPDTSDPYGEHKVLNPGNTFAMPEDHVILYAFWKEDETGGGKSGGGSGSDSKTTYTVTYRWNDGRTDDVYRTDKVAHNTKAAKPADPVREGFTFTGWYTDKACTTEYDFNKAVTASFSLYAGWKEGETVTPPEKYDHRAYIEGYPGGRFGPDEAMTRAQTAQILYNLALRSGRAEPEYHGMFSDVSVNAWYADAVGSLSYWDIIKGDGDKFRPEDQVTRAEFVTMLLRFMETGEAAYTTSGGFPDVQSSHWAAGFIQAAVNAGIIDGFPDGSFKPNDSVTRAQAVVMVNRAIECPGLASGKAFSDVPSTHWAYTAITAAATDHNHE